MTATEHRPASAARAGVALPVAGGLGGLIVAAVIVLNLHILVGLEQGYASSPHEVWDHSAALALVDVALLLGGLLLGALAARRLWRRTSR